jgi:hypothetical protein
MNILAATSVLAEAAEHEGGHGMMWGFIIGGSIMLTFLVLLLITGSFSGAYNRHEAGPDLVDPSKQIGSFGPNEH